MIVFAMYRLSARTSVLDRRYDFVLINQMGYKFVERAYKTPAFTAWWAQKWHEFSSLNVYDEDGRLLLGQPCKAHEPILAVVTRL